MPPTKAAATKKMRTKRNAEAADLREYNRVAKATQRDRNRAAGFCVCGRDIERAAAGLKTCDSCIAAANVASADRRARQPARVKVAVAKKPVRCIVRNCGKATLQPRRLMCPTCYATERRRERAENGVCSSGCGRVPQRLALGIKTCDLCIVKANKAGRLRKA